MQADDIYHRLIAGQSGEPFDAHVLASILAIGATEAIAAREPLPAAIGLDGGELAALLDERFPKARLALPALAADMLVERSEDEACLVDLLRRCATTRSPLQHRLAAMVARRAQRPNHLWQDLGLQNRGELSRLMQVHFAPLASRNARDMKWKKFLYRTICRDVGYSLCTAPSCRDCDDFDFCFGAETGESFLARARRSIEAVH